MKENKKKENKKKVIFAAVVLLITAMVLLEINYCAVKFCMGNLSLFTVMILVVPMVCVAVAALILGFYTKWNWKKEILVALLLTLISFGAGQITTVMAGDSLNETNKEDDLMNELYDELDKQAYAYMLEQGLISEGEVTEIANSEMYVGIQKSDSTTELIGNIVAFFIAFGACVVGSKRAELS